MEFPRRHDRPSVDDATFPGASDRRSPPRTPARSAHRTRTSSQAYDAYKKNVASNDSDDPSASAGADEEDAKRYGTIHPRVWSKDPHGGAYKISSGPGASGGYDALAQRPDGTVIAVEPGYERPAIGPTTNFVGNHMTQGAIDLAQGELTRADPDADRRRERLDFARGTTREPPRLLSKTTVRIDDAHANRHRASRAIERYAWTDAPETIVVTVRDADLPEGADVAAAAATFEPTRFALDAPLPDGSKATLMIHLAGEIEPSLCSHARDADRGEIRAHLVKSSSSAGAWRSLRAESSSASTLPDANDDAPPPPTPSDLAAIRRRLIEQREGRLAARLPWRLEGSKPKDALAAPTATGPDTSTTRDASAAVAAAAAAASRGDHSEADAWCTRALELANESEPGDVITAARALTARASARESIGMLVDARDDCSRALALGALDDDDASRCAFARGRCASRLERYDDARVDFELALRLNPSSVAASEALSEARRAARRHAESRRADRARAAERRDADPPRFARPGMPQFDNRGKSGAAF